MAAGTLTMLAMLLLAGCVGRTGVERTTYFYPTNDVSGLGGELAGHILGDGNLHGTAEVTMPDGELLQGQFSIVAGGTVGTTLTSVGGVLGGGMFTGVSAGGTGEMDMRDLQGTSMTCEFANNNMTAHGYGGCNRRRAAPTD